jgi:hypothetical protein
MSKYYVNNRAQANGDHEVHKDGCIYLQSIVSKTDLGYHSSCSSAVRKAKLTYSQSNGCYYCNESCHTS